MITEVSKRYAKAIYELSKEKNSIDKNFEELEMLSNIFLTKKNIAEYLNSPIISVKEKISLIQMGFTEKFSELIVNFLCLLAENGRMESFHEIVSAFRVIQDESLGITRGQVTSAVKLSVEDQKQVVEIINKVINKKVILNFEENPELMGGLVAQVGGWSFDDTLKSHLAKLNENLKKI